MVGLFERLFGRSGQEKTSKIAKDRLQFVLVQDRINLPSEQMRQMKQEIIEVISKYVTVDMDNVDFELSNRDRSGLLIAEIPFKAAEAPDEQADAVEDKLTISVQPDEPDITAEAETTLDLDDEGEEDGEEETVNDEATEDDATTEADSEDDDGTDERPEK